MISLNLEVIYKIKLSNYYYQTFYLNGIDCVIMKESMILVKQYRKLIIMSKCN